MYKNLSESCGRFWWVWWHVCIPLVNRNGEYQRTLWLEWKSYCLYKECEYSFIHSMKPTEHLFEIERESFPELISREGNLQCLEELNSLWNEICLVPFLLPWFLLNISHLDWGKSFNSFIEQLHKIPIYTNRFDWVKGEDTLKNNIWIMLDILEKSTELFLFFKISKGSP